MDIWEEKEGHFSRKAQHLPGMVEVVWLEFREHELHLQSTGASDMGRPCKALSRGMH